MSKIIIPDHCTLITGRYLWRAMPDASAALHQGRASSPPEDWTAMRDSDDDGDSYPWEICATDSPDPPLPPFASTRVEPWPHSEIAGTARGAGPGYSDRRSVVFHVGSTLSDIWMLAPSAARLDLVEAAGDGEDVEEMATRLREWAER